MGSLTSQKLAQAIELIGSTGADAWLIFVRETSDGGDPVLPLILEGGLTWQSALLVTADGRRAAVVGRFDADPLRASGDWDEVVGYDEGIHKPLLDALERLIPTDRQPAQIAVNYSRSDDKADGLSHGMYLLLEEYLQGTRFALVSAEEILGALRARKTPEEISRVRGAIAETDRLFDAIPSFTVEGRSEREVFDFIQERIDASGLGFAWDRSGDPIVNIGPHSMIGHGIPSKEIAFRPGQILHIDLGVQRNGYSSDIQRCWYLPELGGPGVPDDVNQALDAVNAAISAGAAALRPGVEGWQVDAAGRSAIQERGYPEYQHALGHQVGRTAHDGGGILGPRWERYGRLPFIPVREDEIYTLELGVMVEGKGFIGIEEMVLVTETGCEWLTDRQFSMRMLTH
jgi:Xaa-Pro aminopeptidase